MSKYMRELITSHALPDDLHSNLEKAVGSMDKGKRNKAMQYYTRLLTQMKRSGTCSDIGLY